MFKKKYKVSLYPNIKRNYIYIYIVYTKKKNTYIITKFFIRLFVGATSVLTTSVKNQKPN
jgi:hypothetical protein